jgi:hypothetical protein
MAYRLPKTKDRETKLKRIMEIFKESAKWSPTSQDEVKKAKAELQGIHRVKTELRKQGVKIE